MNAVVVIDPAARTAVVLSPERPRPWAVLQDRPPPSVVAKGFRGPPGPQGVPGDSSTATGRKVVSFSFGDASPVPVLTLAFAAVGVTTRLVIDTAFDGAGAGIKVGTAGSDDALMAVADNDPTQAAAYETAADLALASGAQVFLTIIPGAGATQGAGRLIFDAIAA